MQTLLVLPKTTYKPAKLKMLPLRDQPAYRVTANAAACSLAELLAAVVGGAQQIEVTEGILARFGGDPSAGSGHVLQRIYKAHVSELASVHGVGQQTAVRIKAALRSVSGCSNLWANGRPSTARPMPPPSSSARCACWNRSTSKSCSSTRVIMCWTSLRCTTARSTHRRFT